MKLNRIALAVLGTTLLAAPAFAVNNIDSDAAATVVKAIELTKKANTDLNFGKFTPNVAGPMSINTAGVVSDPEGLKRFNDILPDTAEFTVSGGADCPFVVSITPAVLTLNNTTTPGQTMTVKDFTSNAPVKLDGTGAAEFGIAATLEFAQGQEAGLYKGTYNVSVAYN